MDSHKNAPLTAAGRCRLVEAVQEGQSIAVAARNFRVDRKTVRKWVRRFQGQGVAGLSDRSCRPKKSPRRIARAIAQRIVQLRRRRWTMERIAREVRVSRATVSRSLARAGLSRLSALDPVELPRRYERDAPGELLHIDIKKLGRIGRIGHRITGNRQDRMQGIGWEHVYVAVDDHSRVGYSQILPFENADCATRFLSAAIQYYRSLGIHIERVITDNAKVFTSGPFCALCETQGIKRRRTRFYRPQTNGKAERFIQSALREWAYAHAYRTSRERAVHLPRWLHAYNWHRPHASLGGSPPISRLQLSRGKLLRLHT
jgi:transposase InsO family protein